MEDNRVIMAIINDTIGDNSSDCLLDCCLCLLCCYVSATGDILACPLANLRAKKPQQCDTIVPPDLQPGDDIGLSLNTSPQGKIEV